MLTKLFYYIVAAPVLFLRRLIFWPFKMLLRFFRWLCRWRRDKRRMPRADFDEMDGWAFGAYSEELLSTAGEYHEEG